MRNFGLAMLLLGSLGFFLAGSEVEAPAVPGQSLTETLAQPGGRSEAARYACATAAAIGLILALFPKGR